MIDKIQMESMKKASAYLEKKNRQRRQRVDWIGLIVIIGLVITIGLIKIMKYF